MTASELAFLTLGLLLGAATGGAVLVVLGNRSPRREIRVTVTRDAVPRRSETLSHDAFVTRAAEPAQGGPGDRRWFDRGHSGADRGENRSGWASRADLPAARLAESAGRPSIRPPDRTIVPSVGQAVGIAIEPEADTELDDVRRSPIHGSALERILRGEHLAMVEVVDRVAGQDGQRRREWELLLGGLVDAMADMAVRESVIDFPMGTAFWDTFTVEQCRRIVASLRSMGYRYDGQAGWADQHAPAYRDLTNATADIGVEPRRVRAWPNQAQIAMLFAGARPAPEELLAAAGPEYTADDVRGLVGDRAADLGNLWLAWEVVRPVLFDDRRGVDARIAT